MIDVILFQLGKKIKFYRKARNMNIEELAALIHKSKATISKYETGKISIDIATIYEIASALGIDIHQLLDYKLLPRNAAVNAINSPFKDHDILYLYTYNYHKKKVVLSVMTFNANTSSKINEATLFMNAVSCKNYEECEHLYQGYMNSYDNFTTFILENQNNQIEQLMINVFNPWGRFTSVMGLITGIAADSFNPTSMKVLISKKIISNIKELIDMLILSKEELSRIRKTNRLELTPKSYLYSPRNQPEE